MEECVICFEETNSDSFMFFECQHKVCNICYPIIVNGRAACPICNHIIRINHIILYPRVESYEDIQHIEREACILKVVCCIILIVFLLIVYNGVSLV